MDMTSLNISLPKPMKEFVESQVQRGGYSTPSEYVRALLRAERKRQAESELDELLLQGLNSGEPIEVTPAFWEARQRDLLRLKSRKGRR
jgi:antitoxin ParD1/3/4